MHLPVRVLQAESEALMQAGASTETIGRASVSSDEVPAGKGLETTLGRLGPWATPRRSPREAHAANRSSESAEAEPFLAGCRQRTPPERPAKASGPGQLERSSGVRIQGGHRGRGAGARVAPLQARTSLKAANC